jgi:hypothetical protein
MSRELIKKGNRKRAEDSRLKLENVRISRKLIQRKDKEKEPREHAEIPARRGRITVYALSTSSIQVRENRSCGNHVARVFNTPPSRHIFSPPHKRTEGRTPVWGSKFTSKDAALQGRSSKFLLGRTQNYAICLRGDCVVTGGILPLFSPSLPHTEIKSRHGN